MKPFLTPLLLSLLFAAQASAGILNGDFSVAGTSPEPFADWTTEVDSTTGLLNYDRPTDGGGFTLFKDIGTVGSSQFSQSFSLPSGSFRLSFEFRLSTSGVLRIPASVPDSFQATLLDSSGLTGLLPSGPGFSAFYSIDNDGVSPESFDPLFVTSLPLGGGIRRITLDLSSLAPQSLSIDFLLNGSLDGFSTQVELDNVVLAQNSTVPEPASFLIWSASLGIAGVWHRRRSSRGRLLQVRLSGQSSRNGRLDI